MYCGIAWLGTYEALSSSSTLNSLVEDRLKHKRLGSGAEFLKGGDISRIEMYIKPEEVILDDSRSRKVGYQLHVLGESFKVTLVLRPSVPCRVLWYEAMLEVRPNVPRFFKLSRII